jgi:hypothetical protein
VHFDSGTTTRDYDHRRQAAQRIGQIRMGNTPILELDRDVLVLGDFNTMGQDAPPISAQEELAVFDGELSPGFHRLPMTPNCTEYHEGKGGALDHIVASTGMQEVAATARVTGYCAVAACANLTGALPPAGRLGTAVVPTPLCSVDRRSSASALDLDAASGQRWGSSSGNPSRRRASRLISARSSR